jgi:Holliday junction resolvase-like predicted endonuclease
MLRLLVLLSFAVSTSPVHASAQQVSADYDSLKSDPADYGDYGTICEHVAKLRLEEHYPESEYDIEIGIVYKRGGQIIGELDVVVFDESDGKAIVVSEVKCRRNLDAANSKAREQLERFRSTLESGRSVELFLKNDERRKFSIDQFHSPLKFMAVSQEGGLDSGFEMTIGLDLDEVTQLREMLISCQKRGECPRI